MSLAQACTFNRMSTFSLEEPNSDAASKTSAVEELRRLFASYQHNRDPKLTTFAALVDDPGPAGATARHTMSEDRLAFNDLNVTETGLVAVLDETDAA